MTVEVNGIAAVGDVLAGKYRVDKILGIGGMGMVVAATHLEIDQRVALKFMLPASDTPDTSARFLREARAAGRLNSDHVCRVMDVGRFDSGAPYIVMEYLQGQNLGAVLRRRGPMRVSEAVDYLLQAIEGIAEAHAHGIIHRDLKPDNLFLHKRNDGGAIVKVLDFGISKASAPGVSTSTGDIMGSPAYMAPEQMESTRSVDQRADVWSLGVVLYQMVTGKPPFRGDTLPLVCLAVVNDAPEPMSAIRDDLPDGFEAVVMRCLQKEPGERFVDVGELAQALAPFGPKHATTSASRIQIVLRRALADSASVISHEFATVELTAAPVQQRPDASDGPPTMPARREPGQRGAAPHASPGQSLPRPRAASRGLIGALVGSIAVVVVAIIVVWSRGDATLATSPSGKPAASLPGPTALPASAVVPASATPPIVEPIEQPTAEPIVAPGSVPAAEPPAEPVAAPTGSPTGPDQAQAQTVRAGEPPATRPERPKRKPGRATRARARAGAAAGSAAGPGSAAEPPDEDDKWMRMTHDGKTP
jgi:eukaryotic-like serine/threonine-protein kinase